MLKWSNVQTWVLACSQQYARLYLFLLHLPSSHIPIGQYRSTWRRRCYRDATEPHEEKQLLHPKSLPRTVSVGHHLSILQQPLMHLWPLCVHLPAPPPAGKQTNLCDHCLPERESEEPGVWGECVNQLTDQELEKQAGRDVWDMQVKLVDTTYTCCHDFRRKKSNFSLHAVCI